MALVIASLGLALLPACGGDGPSTNPREDAGTAASFAGATKVELVMRNITATEAPAEAQGDAGAPSSATGPQLELAVRDGRGVIAYVDDFSCGDPYEALVQSDERGYRVLIRFVDSAGGHTACLAAPHVLRFVVGEADASTEVSLYRQDDPDEEIRLVATTQAAGERADCIAVVPCGIEQPCYGEGVVSDLNGPVNQPDDAMRCAVIGGCEGAVCTTSRAGCLMSCGGEGCFDQDSDPPMVACN